MSSQSKIVAEEDRLRDISSLGVKVADRWIAAGTESLCQIYKSFGFVK